MDEYLTYDVQPQHPIVACAISHCGSYLAFNSEYQTLRIVYLKSIRSENSNRENINLNILFEYKMGSTIRCLDFGLGDVRNNRLPHRSSKRRITYPFMNNACLLAVGLKSGQIKIFSLIPGSEFDGSIPLAEKGGNAKLILHEHYEDIANIAFSPDGSLRLGSLSVDGKMCMWDMWDDGNMYKSIVHPNAFRPISLAWGNKGKQVCVVGTHGKGFIYQSEKPCVKLTTLASVHYNDISACKYSSDYSLLGTSSFDTSVVIWCAGTYKPMLQIWHMGSRPSLIYIGGAHNHYIRDFAFSTHCVNLVSISDDNYIRMWNLDDTESAIDTKEIPVTSRKLILHCVRFTPDGSKFIVTTSEGKIHFFNVKSGTESLANLCRKSVREKLVFQLHNLMNNEFQEDKSSGIKPISLLEMTDIDAKIRRRSASDIWSIAKNRGTIQFKDVVEELPIPMVLKSYLQYGLIEPNLLENRNHSSPTRTRHTSFT